MSSQLDWADEPEIAGGQGVDLAGALWRRKWIMLLVLGIGVGLGYFYYLKSVPVFQSAAQVLLLKKEAKLPVAGVEGDAGYEDALSTHMLLIKSPLIVDKAIADYDLDELPTLSQAPNPSAVVIGGLRAARAGGRDAPDPNVIDLSYDGLAPDDCRAILDGILQSYQDYLGETYQNFSAETVDLITKAKDELQQQLTEKENAYRKFRQESPFLWTSEKGLTVHQGRMAEIEEARSSIIVEQAQTKARIDALEKAVAAGGNREALHLLIKSPTFAGSAGTATGETKNTSLAERLFTAMLDEMLLLEDYGPDHPKVQANRKRIAFLRERLAGVSEGALEKPLDFIQVYMESLRQELKETEQRLAEYNTLFEQERMAAKELEQYTLADSAFQADIARTQQLFDGVLKRLEEINLVKDYGGLSTQVMSPPSAGYQVQPKLPIIMMIATVLGAIAGLLLGLLVDMADQRFRSPDEIRAQMGLPVVGHVPLMTRRDQKVRRKSRTALSTAICTYYHPSSRVAESYRAVRTSMFFNARGTDQRVIQVTSPDPEDGKSTLTSNLAVLIADSGKKVLLLDADFRRPKQHTLFGIDNAVGVSDVLGGHADIPEAIKTTAAAKLWVMPAGRNVGNPSELLSSPRFGLLLKVLREKFDFVLIDTPPLLAVTDASTVAARADAVLLVLRLKKRDRAGATRGAAELLKSVGAKISGVVVNGIEHSSQYKYGYAYGYGYGANKYYADEHAPRVLRHAPSPNGAGSATVAK